MKMLCLIFAGALALTIALPATRAQVAGSLDPAFNPNVPPLADDIDPYIVRATVVQPDGKIIIAGNFGTVGGEFRGGLARLLPDGTVESTATFSGFNPVGGGISSGSGIYSAVLQPDGKILLGGSGTAGRLGRINADGTVESTATFNTGAGPNAAVYGMALQADGKIVLGGNFTTVDGQTRNRISRLNADGSVESTATFNPGTGANGIVYSVALQPDGKILLAGDFTSVNGQARNRIARLHADGNLESTATFNPGTGANSTILCVTVQADGKILCGGSFSSVNGQARNRIVRLHADGTVESTATFNPGTGANGSVSSVALQADGKILLSGNFSTVNGQARNLIARLSADGSVESTATFNPGTGPGGSLPSVDSVALQADGKILLGGRFATMNGQPRRKIARLLNDAATQGLTTPGEGHVQWMRGGAAPEVEQVTFESSTDGGANWEPLGPGTRIAGGWERTGLSPPQNSLLRARGRTAGGNYNGTSGLVEQVATFVVNPVPEIAVEQPMGANLADGASVSFPAVPGANVSRTFTIRNPGYADLTGLGITIDGPDAALFTVTASPTAPVAGPTGSTTFTVQFAHVGAGPKNAALHIASNDPDENPFDLLLLGRDPFTDANLADLVLSAGTLSPAFAAATTSYMASVSATTASVTVTPITADATATVQVNGVPVASGSASGAIALSVGSNLLTIAVTAEDGVTTKTYTVNVTRSAPGPGAVDQDFNLNVVGLRVRATAVQPDGKTLIVGTFSSIGGQARNKIARLNADGTVESTATFNPGTGASDDVTCVAFQPDGKILIGGWFLNVNGQARTRIVRLLPNGSVESTATFNPGTGANSGVESIAVQADGKIVLGGFFTSVNGQPRNSVARLHADGTLESSATFNPGTGANGAVRSVVVQPDGKILLGGWFTSVNGQTRNYLARLHADGTLESTATFNPGTGAGPIGFFVNCVAVQADGKILVGGQFATFNGQPRNRIARLLADGTLESTATFNIGTGAENGFYGVQSLAVQADGKILLGGEFTSVNGQPRSGIARLHPDGSVENTVTFDPGTGVGGTVYSVALQADGKIVLGGEFTAVYGQPRNNLARLGNDAATQTLSVPNNTRVAWTRGGAAPEVEPVTFELSTNGGASWSALGAGVRIAGGWERTGLSLPVSGSIRARGRAAAGSWNGSSGLVEQITAFTALTRLESWRLAYFGSPANSGPGADGNDSDHDGSVNVLEFATLRDPTRADSATGALSINGAVLEFRYQRAKAAVLDGLTFAVEWSNTLEPGSWSSAGVSESILSDDGTVQEILATIPAGAARRWFVKLRVDAL
ncbi:MAG: cadherin-like beta sandwich domain-containing protein [Verrucomicrobiales bacterium]